MKETEQKLRPEYEAAVEELQRYRAEHGLEDDDDSGTFLERRILGFTEAISKAQADLISAEVDLAIVHSASETQRLGQLPVACPGFERPPRVSSAASILLPASVSPSVAF